MSGRVFFVQHMDMQLFVCVCVCKKAGKCVCTRTQPAQLLGQGSKVFLTALLLEILFKSYSCKMGNRSGRFQAR